MKLVGVTGRAGSGKDEVALALARYLGCRIVSLADPMKRLAMAVFAFSVEQLWGPSEARNGVDLRYLVVGSSAMVNALPLPWVYAWERLEHAAGRWLEELDLSYEVHMPGLRRWFALLAMEAAGLDRRLAPLGHRKPLTPRRALQTLGTEWGRTQREDIWVDYLVRVAERLTTEDVIYDRVNGITTRHFEAERVAGVIVPDNRYDNEARAIRARGGKVVLVERPGVGLTGEAGAHASERGVSGELLDGIVLNDDTLEELHRRARNLADAFELIEPNKGAA